MSNYMYSLTANNIKSTPKSLFIHTIRLGDVRSFIRSSYYILW